MRKRVLCTLILILSILLMIFGYIDYKLIQENQDLKHQIQVQHNHYVECKTHLKAS